MVTNGGESRYKQYVVWTGAAWWPTWAVSEKKAASNIAYRMRQMGKFPNTSLFEVKVVKPGESLAGVQW